MKLHLRQPACDAVLVLQAAELALDGGAATVKADFVLTTSARDAARMVNALVPLAQDGELDEKLVRVLRYRRTLAVPGP